MLQIFAQIKQQNQAFSEIAIVDLSGRTFSGNAQGWVPNYNARKRNREWFISIVGFFMLSCLIFVDACCETLT